MNRSEDELVKLISRLDPVLSASSYVFVTVANASYGDMPELNPVASFAETEGLTLVVPKELADRSEIPYDAVFRQITLSVQSELTSVGLTAAVSSELARFGISANVVAAYHHDHIFVPEDRAIEAVEVLRARMRSGRG